MKKILIVFICIVSLISFIGCDNKDIINTGLKETITLGKYPQSIVKDQTIINQLLLCSSNDEGIIMLDDAEYIYIDEQYYKLENIEWELIKNQNLYISKYILDCQVFLRQEYVNVIGNSMSKKPGIPSNIYSNNYIYSDLREWLNEEFYNYAFSDSDKEKLTKIKTESLNDYVYTLSYAETSTIKTLTTSATDYAKSLGIDVFDELENEEEFNGNSTYWLRDANQIHRYRVFVINYNGVCYEFVDCYYNGVGVRPVIKLK